MKVLLLVLAVCGLLLAASKPTQTESVVPHNVYEQDVLIRKTAACTSAVFSTRTFKDIVFEVKGCAACKVSAEGNIGGSTYINIIDSIVANGICRVPDTMMVSNMRWIISRVGASDTVTVWVLGKSY